jgi:hypothetical protein
VRGPLGPAFAEDLERDTLQQIAEAATVGKESVRIGHEVDKTRGNDLAMHIDIDTPAIGGHVTRFGDLVPVDGNPSACAT